LFKGFNLSVDVGERIAIIGPNGAGKTTLLRCLQGDLEATAGKVKWSENSVRGYYAQDHAADFQEDKILIDWIGKWGKDGDDEQVYRATLGRLLFSGDEIKKSVRVISGGEQGRMLFGKIMLQRPNIMLMDEPTNHLDMESIESLNLALENYPGTLFFVSHDREFVSSLATRILEFTPNGINDYKGTYEEYLRSQGVE
jgi:ATPase subunit of ABC transporter with duplicated ATPase domains